MDILKVDINDKTYHLRFDYRWNRMLAEYWGFTKPIEVQQKLMTVNISDENHQASFEELDVLRDFFYIAFKASGESPFEDADALMTWLMSNREAMNALLLAYFKSLPQVDDKKGEGEEILRDAQNDSKKK